MKLFVHLEDDDVSARVTLTPAVVTLADVLQVFCRLHTRRRRASSASGSSVAAAASHELTPVDVDVFVERELEGGARVPFAADKRALRWFARRQRSAAAVIGGGGDDCDCDCDFELVLVRKRPTPTATASTQAQHLQQRKLRAAMTLFETLVLPLDPTNARALLAMGDIHAANQRFDVAVTRWYTKCWDTVLLDLESARDETRGGSKDAQLAADCGLKIAHCELQRGQPREALQVIGTLERWLQGLGADPLPSMSPIDSSALESRMDLLKAEALYALRSESPELQDAAVALLTKLLPDLQSPSLNLDALLLYSTIAFDCGKKSDALNMVLRVLVARPDDRAVRRQLARFFGGGDGLELLEQAVPLEGGGASSAAAYAFIGTILKDFSALEASVGCFERAELMNPASPSYALNHAHVLEVCNEYERALAVLVSFFRRNATLSAGGGQLTTQEFLSALEIDGSDAKDAELSQQQPKEMIEEAWRIEWRPSGSGGHAVVCLEGEEAETSSVTAKSEALAPLEQDELDLLACFFATVKILFVAGRVSGLPRLIRLIEPVRVGRELHRTAIRNEQAYYSCIVQLLTVTERFVAPGSELAAPDPSRSIYVCGDSHTLATAWREIRVQGERVVLRPALVTGLKHWHLRAHAEFYPKANFWRVLGGLPPRAKVIFLFGEIDCREGILVAVEKSKYESVEEGMEATIRIFMDALADAVDKFDFEAFIHPVVPVLNETRALVVQYNRIFKRRVDASAVCTWLDFFDDLLVPAASPAQSEELQLRPEFALDGTHLHPRYLETLERAVSVSVRGQVEELVGESDQVGGFGAA